MKVENTASLVNEMIKDTGITEPGVLSSDPKIFLGYECVFKLKEDVKRFFGVYLESKDEITPKKIEEAKKEAARVLLFADLDDYTEGAQKGPVTLANFINPKMTLSEEKLAEYRDKLKNIEKNK